MAKWEVNALLDILEMNENEQREVVNNHLHPQENWKHDWAYSNAVGGSDDIATGSAWYCRKCERSEIVNNEAIRGKFIPAVLDNQVDKSCSVPDKFDGSFADLAFRLRDELGRYKNSNWRSALLRVYLHACKASSLSYEQNKKDYYIWFVNAAQPIHWIIAALIAEVRKIEEQI